MQFTVSIDDDRSRRGDHVSVEGGASVERYIVSLLSATRLRQQKTTGLELRKPLPPLTGEKLRLALDVRVVDL